jgi:Tol biopolymer transport system component
VSPDGSQIALGADDGREAIVWTYDLAGSRPMQRVTFGGNNRYPIWAPDGKRVAFQSDRDGDAAIFWQPVEGPATAERLTGPSPGETHVPESWSPDGEHLLFTVNKGTDTSLWTFSLAGRKALPYGDVHSSNPTGAVFSPDGRWVAYGTTEAGSARLAIFVQPFPATGAKYQLVVDEPDDAFVTSPHKPVWSPDGKGLFYIPRLGGFELVSVTTRPGFAFGKAARIARPFSPGAPNFRRLFDVTPQGTFVGLVPFGSADPVVYTTAPQVDVVLNWFEEVRSRVK